MTTHTIKLIGNKMQFIVKPDEPYFDPETGLYIPSRPNPPCSGFHDLFDIYWEPCVDCEKFCNCESKRKYPDVLVTSLDGLTVKVSGNVVASSNVLVQLMNGHRDRARRAWLDKLLDTLGLRESYQKIAKEDKNQEILIDLTLDSDDDNVDDDDDDDNNNKRGRVDQVPIHSAEDQTVELSELFEFPQNQVFDLRNGNEPTYGLTEAQWIWLEKFIGLHLDQVDENIAAERRAREYFRLSLYNRPAKDPINHWGYYDWEEELFMNMSPYEMIQLSQIKHELRICDLNVPVEKWFILRRGFPMIKDFGWGQYRTDLNEEYLDSGVEDFLWGRPKVTWNHTMTIHNLDYKLRRDDPRNAFRFRKRIWESWPHSNLSRLRRK